MEICYIDVVLATINDNILYGRGVDDMKSFITVVVKIFEYMIKNNIGLK